MIPLWHEDSVALTSLCAKASLLAGVLVEQALERGVEAVSFLLAQRREEVGLRRTSGSANAVEHGSAPIAQANDAASRIRFIGAPLDQPSCLEPGDHRNEIASVHRDQLCEPPLSNRPMLAEHDDHGIFGLRELMGRQDGRPSPLGHRSEA
jgi:hypothetical protein